MNTAYQPSRIAYSIYRRIKRKCLTAPDTVSSKAFFLLAGFFDRLLSLRAGKDGGTSVWDKNLYLTRFPSRTFSLDTEHPLATESDDYKFPRGAKFDNSVNPRFNQRLYEIFDGVKELRLLDLGCAGGGLVQSIIADGHVALGIEGSDVPFIEKLGAWGRCPNNLFTGDITRPFTILSQLHEPYDFNVVTAWEVLEHISESDVPQLLANIAKHLQPGGIFVGSVDLEPDGNPLTGACYHKIFHDKSWWLDQASRFGLVEWVEHSFEVCDFVRGTGQGLKDWSPESGSGFHLVLRKQ